MFTEASAAIGGIKTAFGIAQGITALKSETEINLAVISIQRTLLDAQNAALADKELITNLRQQLSELQALVDGRRNWDAERERYVLTESPLGAFTYNLRPESANGEPMHRLCSTCFTEGRKSILHTRAKHSGGELVHCGTCKTDLALAKFTVQRKPIRRVTNWMDR